MLLLSRVCAEFHDEKGNVLFSVTPASRHCFLDAPESIRRDPLFAMLVNDGSLEVADTAVRRKMLEQDPVRQTDASGKKPAASRSPRKNPEPSEKPEDSPLPQEKSV